MLRSVQSPTNISDRISVLKVNTKQGAMHIVNAYASTLAANAQDRDYFYNQLQGTIMRAGNSDHVILLGDLHARDGADPHSWPVCIGHFGVGKMNENGLCLLELCCRNNLVVTNTIFPGKPHRKMFCVTLAQKLGTSLIS